MLKKFAHLVHTGRHTQFHIFAAACLGLGLFIAFTAGEMGPFAPLLIAVGIYLMFFVALLELIFWTIALLRRVTLRWIDHDHDLLSLGRF